MRVRRFGLGSCNHNILAPNLDPRAGAGGFGNDVHMAGQRAQIERRAALKRLPTVTDIAAAVAFLLSDAAANITGTVLTVDAGNTA